MASWQHRNGLDADAVMAIAQTTDGFLWLATEQGLIRYDGVTFVTFDERNAPGLGDRFIRSLAADPDGGLWIGTQSGLSRYRDGKFEDLRRQAGINFDIYDLCLDGSGGVFFSSDHGLYRFSHGRTRLYTTADGLPANGIGGLSRGPDGTIWIGTTRALASFKDGKFTAYGQWSGFRNNAINAVSAGAGGAVWIGMRDGTVGRWDHGVIATWWDGASTRGKRIECLREDSQGSLWIAIKKLGLARMRGPDLQVMTVNGGMPSNSPDWIFEDRENSLWIGWADAGLSMLRDTKFNTFGKPEGLSSDNISSVTQASDGGLWVGTGDAGLDHIPGRGAGAELKGEQVKVLTKADGLAQNEVLGLLQQRDGTLWVGSETGQLTRIQNGRATAIRVSETLSPGIPAMVEDRGGQVWFGIDMPGGLATLRDGHFERTPLKGAPHSLAIAPDGSLWVSSYLEGLARVRQGSFRVYGRNDGLPSLALTSVYADPAGVVWAGTLLSGLVRWKDGKITSYTTQQGLFDDAVGGIVEDDRGYLWMAGSRGIWRVALQELNDYADGKRTSVRSEAYGYSSGLRSTETSFSAQPAVWKAADGRLWFATGGGLSSIDPGTDEMDPGHILTNRVPPSIAIERVLYDGKPISLPQRRDTEVDLAPGEGSLAIAFTAPSFVEPEKMQFRYRLVGEDRDWVKAGADRAAAYSHLAPGRYRFELQAANNDGLWSPVTVQLDLKLAAHFYQTMWFWALACLWLGLAIWRAYAARVRYFTRKTRELEEIVAQRTSEVRSALEIAEAAKERLLDQATKDGLTGLWNRRTIFEIFERELKRCREAMEPCCVLMVDADHFKSINDTYGHLAGDLVIQTISQRLRQRLRTNEAIGRYGGEEILVLLPRCPFEAALRRAEELRVAIAETPVVYEDKAIRVTCSFGLGQLQESAESVSEIIDEADRALYAAKRGGRNCVRGCAETAAFRTTVTFSAAETPSR